MEVEKRSSFEEKKYTSDLENWWQPEIRTKSLVSNGKNSKWPPQLYLTKHIRLRFEPLHKNKQWPKKQKSITVSWK